MADAKPSGGDGGGSNGWEWIIVIILAMALIAQFTGKPIKPILGTDEQQKEDIFCGLSLARPKPLEKVGSFVTVSGTVAGCQWVTQDGVAMYAQVVDSRGKPVSKYTTIPAVLAEGYSSFSASVPITAKPSSGTGTLILIPATAINVEHQVTARIPLQFK